MPDLPILGQGNTSNGRGPAVVDLTYAVQLNTSAGDEHVVTFTFQRPTGGTDGVIDLGAVAGFDPERQSLKNIINALVGGTRGNPAQHPPVIESTTGALVVWAHVTSIRYLGVWTDEDETASDHAAVTDEEIIADYNEAAYGSRRAAA